MNQNPTIYVCDNRETVCDGYVTPSTAGLEQEILDAWTTGALAAESDFRTEHPELEFDVLFDGNFKNWNGGRYSSYQCGRKIGADTFGYQLHGVATLEKNPPDWLKELVVAIHAGAAGDRDECVRELEASDA